MTTDGEISFHEWKKGKWAVFFSHPAEKQFQNVEEAKPYLRYADAP